MSTKHPTDLRSVGTLALEYGMTVAQLRCAVRWRVTEYRVGRSILFSKREIQEAIAAIAEQRKAPVRRAKAREVRGVTP